MAGGPPIMLAGEPEVLIAAAGADSTDADAHYQAALAHWKKKRWDEVDRELNRALTIDPHHAESYLARSYAVLFRYAQEEWFETFQQPEFQPVLVQSREDFRMAFLSNPLVDLQLPGALFGEEKTVVQFGPMMVEYLGFTPGKAYHFFGKRDYQGALDFMIETGGSDMSERPTIFLWLKGLAAAHVGNVELATESFDAILGQSFEAELSDSLVSFSPQTNVARFVLAWVHQQSGNYNQASYLYGEALSADLGLYQAHSRIAEINEVRNRLDEALENRESAIFLNPEDSYLHVDLAQTLLLADRSSEAVEAIREAVDVNPLNPVIRYRLANILSRADNNREAAVAYRTFLEMAPESMAQMRSSATERLAALEGGN